MFKNSPLVINTTIFYPCCNIDLHVIILNTICELFYPFRSGGVSTIIHEYRPTCICRTIFSDRYNKPE